MAGAYNVNRRYSVNGLNQYTSAGPATFGYDANGNLTSDGSTTFTYDNENRLVAASGARTAALRYDPLGRLYEVTGSAGTTRFLYDGDALVAEYTTAGTLTARYVHGSNAAADDPLIWYDAGTARWLHADHQGSIVAITNGAGGSPSINAYDEWGIPNDTNAGRFQYTGQAWLANSPCTTTRPASTPQRSAASCRPIRLGTTIRSTSMPMCIMIRSIMSIQMGRSPVRATAAVYAEH